MNPKLKLVNLISREILQIYSLIYSCIMLLYSLLNFKIIKDKYFKKPMPTKSMFRYGFYFTTA